MIDTIARSGLFAFVVCSLGCDGSQSRRTLEQPAGEIPVWATEAVPHLVVSSTDGDAQLNFAHAAGGVSTSDGGVALVDSRGPAVVFFDSAGRRTRSAGRRGKGPGEFLAPAWIGRCAGDTLFVWDRLQHRLSAWSPGGEYLRDVPAPVGSVFLSCDRTGIIAAMQAPRTVARGERPGTGERLLTEVRIFTTRGDSLGTIRDVPAGELRPLGVLTRITNGSGRIWVGTADSAFVHVFDERGELSGGQRLRGDRRPATRAHFEAAVDELVAMMSVAAQRRNAKTMLMKGEPPKLLPAYSELVADESGMLWSVMSTAGDTITRLQLVGPSGEITANVDIAADIRVFDVTNNMVLGAVSDRVTGEQEIRRYRVGPSGAAAAGRR